MADSIEETPSYCFLAHIGADPEIVRLQKVLRGALAANATGENFLDPDEFHVTLAYATGDNKDDLLVKFDALHLDASQPLMVSIEGMSVFDTADGYAVHLTVTKSPPLMQLQSVCSHLMLGANLGLSPFSQVDAYRPHITLAYLTEPVKEVEFTPFTVCVSAVQLSGENFETLAQ